MHVPALYGVSVNYSGNCLHDEHTSGNICKLLPDFKHKLCESMTLVPLIRISTLIFCEHDACTILPASVGLALAHPNQINRWMDKSSDPRVEIIKTSLTYCVIQLVQC